jgi:uncharacterized membrane protein
MENNSSTTPYMTQPLPLYFAAGLVIVNTIAIFQFDPFYIGSLFAFLYIVITPGFLTLPFLTPKKFPPMLGMAFSVALSLLILMVAGLFLNILLPLVGDHTPLTTLPLLITFDLIIYVLLLVNYEYRKNSSFELHEFNLLSWIIIGVSFLLPVLSVLGAIILNDNGSNFLTMLVLGIIFLLLPVMLFTKVKLSPTVTPLSLYMMGLSMLLMNSMRGWFITGHDILLEYHVFTLTNDAHLWSMAFYQDPYNACLSLTILPTFIEQLIHVVPSYIFKFFTQFIGALPVVIIYYIVRKYVSEKVALLCGFLYVTFPTFMVDMAFLNRQGIAFVFFASMVYVLFDEEHFSGWKRTGALFLFGIGIILSHYSTSYVTVAVLLSGYVVNRVLRFVMTTKKPLWLFKLVSKMGNKEMYAKPIRLTLPFVLGFLCLMIFWSTIVTKTSGSLFTTLEQIGESILHPLSNDGYTGPAKYSLFNTPQQTPAQLYAGFLQNEVQKAGLPAAQSAYYPASIVDKYHTIPTAEPVAPLTTFGQQLQTLVHVDLSDAFNICKQFYAKIIQLFLLIGLAGMIIGYSFRKNLLHDVPVEYLALSIAGLIVIVGQTILPSSAVDYGLLRLFQQNLTFLVLPIILGLICVASFITKNHKAQLAICASVLLFFFLILSGFLTQFTGGARAPLSLDNYGLYYDSYYVHAQEVASIQWLAANGDPSLPIQAAHFSDIKMLAYGHIGAYIELVPETTKRDAYVYLNYDNVKTSDIIEIVNGDVVYYHFPMNFLNDNKDLIYSNGGSAIYR